MQVRVITVNGEQHFLNCSQYKCQTYDELIQKVFSDGYIMDSRLMITFTIRNIERIEGY